MVKVTENFLQLVLVVISKHTIVFASLIPRPLPDFILQPWRNIGPNQMLQNDEQEKQILKLYWYIYKTDWSIQAESRQAIFQTQVDKITFPSRGQIMYSLHSF